MISRLIPRDLLEQSISRGDVSKLENRMSGASTGVALSHVAASMLNIKQDINVFGYTDDETKILLAQVRHIISTLEFSYFQVNVQARGFTINYNPWRTETAADLMLGIPNDLVEG
tara:strand:- start:7163 stop:7507 length:345 start_codon:yes stop_codon:yes gene_type:complete